MAHISLDVSKIKAITLDLDDTLWPIWPAIERAEKALAAWLLPQAPVAAAVFTSPERRLALRQQVLQSISTHAHDLSAIRRESIRLALHQAGEPTVLADPAFDVFFAERMRVEFYEDALPALRFLAERYPIVAVSNGNADVHQVGVGEFFTASVSAQVFGLGKPDPRIFHEAARLVNLAPEQVLHVGDDSALDVLGALGAGMQTVWVNRGAQAWPHGDPFQLPSHHPPHHQRPHATVADLYELCALLTTKARAAK